MKLSRTLGISLVGISLVVVLALLLAVTGSALALVEQLTLDELTAKADSILVGEVTDITCYQEGEGYIYTLVTLSVEQTIKGAAQEEVVIKLPGGEVDGLRLWVSDTPSFQLGERVVVFLEEVDHAFQVCGWYQGKFTVENALVLEREQSLANFVVDICQAMEAQGIAPQLSAKPASMVLESPMESQAVEPAKTVEFQAGWQNIMTDGFEGAFPGVWTVGVSGGATDAYWGKDNYRSYSGSYSAFCAKNGSAGVNPPNHYPNNMAAWMVYGPFSLSDATDAQLNFYFWNQSELDYDSFAWTASVDYEMFYGWQVSGDSSGWQYQSFDLTNVPILGNLCGQHQVWIAFVFQSDYIYIYEGAYVDHIELRKYVAEGEPPHIDSINPSSASAGTESAVTITGTDFGAIQDSSAVTFWRVESEYVEAPIVSWSDTQIVCQVPSGASSGDTSHGVRVTTSAGTSNDYPFTVTFSYSGYKWPGDNPMGEKVLINPNTADCTGEWRAVINAMQTWNDVDDANFYFEYGGLTTATAGSWDAPNDVNEILWVDYQPPDFPSGWIAVNLGWSLAGEIFESDIVFNDLEFTWDTSGSPSLSEMDVQNVATHELGHSFRLLDLYGDADSEKTMYGYGAGGETEARTLEAEDIAGIQWIYPGTGTRGQYHLTVTNNDDDDLTVYFKSDIDAEYYRHFDVPSGQTLTSWWEVLLAGSHQVSIKWTDPDKGTEDFLTSGWLDVPVEGDTEFPFTIPLYTGNNPPNTPSSPSPADDATGVSIDADLSWTGGDPDPGDTVTYDVYFGTSPTPPLVSNDQPGQTYDPGTLSYDTHYYWRIVATDNHGASTDGPLWDFTTESAPTPTIGHSPTSFNFDAEEGVANPPDQTLEIWNSGGGTLNWSVSDDAAWLTLAPLLGSSTGETDNVIVSVDISGMSAGSYPATITISAPGATNTSQTVPVSLNVIPAMPPPIRDLPDHAVIGGSFEVTVTFTAPTNDFNSIGLSDEADGAYMSVAVDETWCDPDATWANEAGNRAEYIWGASYGAGTAFTAVYQVTVDPSTPEGLYPFSGTLEYYIGTAGPFEAPIGGDSEVLVTSILITGETGQVNCSILPFATVELYEGGLLIDSTISDAGGSYSIGAPEPGDYDVVVSKWGFKDETQSISIPGPGVYTLNFRGEHGLVPKAPDMSYVLQCVNHWLYPELPCDLTMSKVLQVVNAWLYPEEVTYATWTTDDFAIDYPEDWEESAEMEERWGSIIAFAEPGVENTYFTVGMTMLPGLYDVWTIFDYARENVFPNDYPGYTPLDEGIATTVDDLDAILHSFTFTEDGTAMKVKLLYTIDGLNAWSVKCYAPEAAFSQYEATFDHILGSFTLSPSEAGPYLEVPGPMYRSVVETASPEVSVLRDMPLQVNPGETFQVTVTFAAPEDDFNSIGLSDEADVAYMTVAVDETWCDPDATWANAVGNRAEYIWGASYGAGTAFTAVYLVTVDPSTPEGLYPFSGWLEYYVAGTGPYAAAIGGDSEVQIVGLDADFIADETEVMVCGEVQFTDLTTGGSPPYSYEWDFENDGIVDSTEPNPSHYYAEPRTYTVSLKVTDSEENTDTEEKVNYITVVNSPPNVPSDPLPADNATDVSIYTDLSWTGGDPNACDTVTYDVYFDTTEDPPLVSEDQLETTYDPGTLGYNTHYYWKIVAADNHGTVTEGDLWDFTTRARAVGGGGGGGAPPRRPRLELEVDMMGRVASGSITEEGVLEEAINVTSRDGVVTLHLVEGTVALDSQGNRLEEVTVDSVSEPPALPEKWYVIGIAYDFGPDGATLDPSIDLTILYDPEELPEGVNEEDLVIAYYHSESGEWRLLPGVVDTGAHTVTSSIGHFTCFAIIGREAPAFALADLSIFPSTVDPGDSVTISTEVTNTGGMEGTCTITLLIDGAQEATQDVALGLGASETVTFTVTRDIARTYTVEIDGLTGEFAVLAPPFPWALLGGILGALVLIAAAITVYLVVFRRRRVPA